MKSLRDNGREKPLCRYISILYNTHFHVYTIIIIIMLIIATENDNKRVRLKVQSSRPSLFSFRFHFKKKAAKTSLLCVWFFFVNSQKNEKNIEQQNTKKQKFQWECLAYLSIFPLFSLLIQSQSVNWRIFLYYLYEWKCNLKAYKHSLTHNKIGDNGVFTWLNKRIFEVFLEQSWIWNFQNKISLLITFL